MYFASGSFQDVCVELIRVVQGRLFQSPPFISNLLRRAFRYPRGIDVCCHTSFFTVFVTAWVLAMNKIAHSKATSSKKNLTSFSSKFAFCALLCVLIFYFHLKNEKSRRKSQNHLQLQCSGRRLEVDQAGPISIESSTSFAMHCG